MSSTISLEQMATSAQIKSLMGMRSRDVARFIESKGISTDLCPDRDKYVRSTMSDRECAYARARRYRELELDRLTRRLDDLREKAAMIYNNIYVAVTPKKVCTPNSGCGYQYVNIPTVVLCDSISDPIHKERLTAALYEYFGCNATIASADRMDEVSRQHSRASALWADALYGRTARFTGNEPQSFYLCCNQGEILPQHLQGTSQNDPARNNDNAFAKLLEFSATEQKQFNKNAGWPFEGEGVLRFASAFYLDVAPLKHEIRLRSERYDEQYIFAPAASPDMVLVKAYDHSGLFLCDGLRLESVKDIIKQYVLSGANLKRARKEVAGMDIIRQRKEEKRAKSRSRHVK